MPLSMVAPGETVRLVGIRGGMGVKHRLADMGLTPGSVLTVVQGHSDGPIIVAFRGDARLAVGRGVAHRVQVELLAD